MALTVDRSAVLAGARLAVVVGGPIIAAAQALKSLAGIDVSILAFVVLLVGLGAGGRRAALLQPTVPLTHGALAALAAYAALFAVVTAIRLALGKDVADPVYIVSNGLWVAAAGILGGYLAIRKLGRTPA